MYENIAKCEQVATLQKLLSFQKQWNRINDDQQNKDRGSAGI